MIISTRGILTISFLASQAVVSVNGEYLTSSLYDTTGCSKDSLKAVVYMTDSAQQPACPLELICSSIPLNDASQGLYATSLCTKANPEDDVKSKFSPTKPYAGSVMYTDPLCKTPFLAAFLVADGSCFTTGMGSGQVFIGKDGSVSAISYSTSMNCKGDNVTEFYGPSAIGVCIPTGGGMGYVKIVVEARKGISTSVPVGIIIGVVAIISVIGLGILYRERVRQEVARVTMQAATVAGQTSPTGTKTDEKQGLLR